MTSDTDAKERSAADEDAHHDAASDVSDEPFGAMDSNEQTLVLPSESLLPDARARLDSANLFGLESGTGTTNVVTGSHAIRFDRRAGVVGSSEASSQPKATPTAPSVRTRSMFGSSRRSWWIGAAACIAALALAVGIQALLASRHIDANRPAATSLPAPKADSTPTSQVPVTSPSAPAPEKTEAAPSALATSASVDAAVSALPQEAPAVVSAKPVRPMGQVALSAREGTLLVLHRGRELETPVLLKLPAGSQQVQVRSAPDEPARSVTVDVVAGEITDVTLE